MTANGGQRATKPTTAAQPHEEPAVADREAHPSNQLLAALSPWAYMEVKGAIERRRLDAGTSLYAVQDRTDEVVFPITSVVSLSTLGADGRAVGVTLIGHEGGIGVWLALGLGRSPWEIAVRGAGEAYVLPVDRFRTLLRDEPDFRERMVAYGRSLFDATTEALTCARLHSRASRVARWLLEADDRSSDGLQPTVALVEAMLGEGLSRGAVLLAAVAEAGTVVVTPSAIHIRDRRALEAAACACYAGPNERH